MSNKIPTFKYPLKKHYRYHVLNNINNLLKILMIILDFNRTYIYFKYLIAISILIYNYNIII